VATTVTDAGDVGVGVGVGVGVVEPAEVALVVAESLGVGSAALHPVTTAAHTAAGATSQFSALCLMATGLSVGVIAPRFS
jgi:hypothetical protein